MNLTDACGFTKRFEGREVGSSEREWFCTAAEFWEANAELPAEECGAVDALAVGQSCRIGGGASPLMVVTRVT